MAFLRIEKSSDTRLIVLFGLGPLVLDSQALLAGFALRLKKQRVRELEL
jgi:hypothetical protein